MNDLSFFGRQRSHKITIVFDGWQGGSSTESRKKEQGISVIYSRLGERADEVIKRLAQESKRELTIVTSDRGIIQALESKRILTMGAQEFQERLLRSGQEAINKKDEIEVEPVKTKKGNPRRLPKAQRKKHKQWDKI